MPWNLLDGSVTTLTFPIFAALDTGLATHTSGAP